MASRDHLIEPADPAELSLAAPGRMTEEEFVAWCNEDTRAEWADGEVIMMSPQNTEHAGLGGWLVSLLSIFVEQRDLGRVLYEVQVRLPEQRRRRTPDLIFIAKGREDSIHRNHVEGPPDLIVEIVSPDSEARDWREKYLEYQAGGVREYWVIDPMSEHMEAYLLGGEPGREAAQSVPAQYQRIHEEQGVIRSGVLADLRLHTAWLWPATRPKVLDALRDLGLQT